MYPPGSHVVTLHPLYGLSKILPGTGFIPDTDGKFNARFFNTCLVIGF